MRSWELRYAAGISQKPSQWVKLHEDKLKNVGCGET
jgi:hypothetical protein